LAGRVAVGVGDTVSVGMGDAVAEGVGVAQWPMRTQIENSAESAIAACVPLIPAAIRMLRNSAVINHRSTLRMFTPHRIMEPA